MRRYYLYCPAFTVRYYSCSCYVPYCTTAPPASSWVCYFRTLIARDAVLFASSLVVASLSVDLPDVQIRPVTHYMTYPSPREDRLSMTETRTEMLPMYG